MSIELNSLNQFVQAHGGIHTYIGLDEEGDSLHVACLALEAMGCIKRSIDEEHHVFWISTHPLERDGKDKPHRLRSEGE